jgi:hypothetical protein
LIIYNKLARPFEDPKLNKLEIFNELCIMAAAYHLFIFTPFVDDPAFQYKAGWSIIGVTTFNIAVNMAVMGWASYKNLKLKMRIVFFKYKAWKLKRQQSYKE